MGRTKKMPPMAMKKASCQTAIRVAAEKTFGSETERTETALPEMSRRTKTDSSGLDLKTQKALDSSSS